MVHPSRGLVLQGKFTHGGRTTAAAVRDHAQLLPVSYQLATAVALRAKGYKNITK